MKEKNVETNLEICDYCIFFYNYVFLKKEEKKMILQPYKIIFIIGNCLF